MTQITVIRRIWKIPNGGYIILWRRRKMKVTTLDEIIERDVPEELYFKKRDWERRKYLKTSLPM